MDVNDQKCSVGNCAIQTPYLSLSRITHFHMEEMNRLSMCKPPAAVLNSCLLCDISPVSHILIFEDSHEKARPRQVSHFRLAFQLYVSVALLRKPQSCLLVETGAVDIKVFGMIDKIIACVPRVKL